MNRNLSQPLFHGTSHDLEGDTLRPGHRMGATQSDTNRAYGQSAKDWVSATPNEETAWKFAYIQGGGRSRVHEVEPHPEQKIGVENREHPVYKRLHAADAWRRPEDNDEIVAPSFRVKDTHWGPVGSQPALSPLDWNALRGKLGPGYHGDENISYPESRMKALHGTALEEHYDRHHGPNDTMFQRKQVLARKGLPVHTDPNQLKLF